MCQEYREHVSKGVTEELRTFVNEVALESANHIFYKRKGNNQEAYCTKCKTDFITKGLRHNEYAKCPICKKEFQCKADGKGRKSLAHAATILWFEKSIKDEKVLVARGFSLRRSFEGDYRNIEDEYLEEEENIQEEQNSDENNDLGNISRKSSLLNDGLRAQLKGILSKIENEVTLVSIVDRNNTKSIELRDLVLDISDLGEKINAKIFNRGENKDVEEKINADKYPIVALLDENENYSEIKFHGVQGCHELNSIFILNLVICLLYYIKFRKYF